MLYSSLLFIYGFLPVSLLLYYALPKKHQPLVLLILSAVFCASFSLMFAAFMVLYVLINYGSCLVIGQHSGEKRCGGLLPFALCMVFDAITIAFFRSQLFEPMREELGIASAFFPIGISFFTLSAMGTLADVYARRIQPEKSLVRYALYIMMFPRLIMGPVMRYASFSRALDERGGGLSDIGKGFSLYITGLAKKVILADALFALYSAVRSRDVSNISALTAWLGALAFILCLYFTLSGFADMGTGLALCFGFRFPKSFNYPMFSTRIRIFYARWQTQIVMWFRKHLTRPLSLLSRRRIWRISVFVAVWGVFGFWYTFSINGFVWGVILGMAIKLERHFVHAKIMNLTGVVYTFLAVMFTSVIFLGGDLSYSLRYIIAMIGGNRNLADALSLYLLKSYIVILLVSMYASTDLFRNVRIRIKNTKLQVVSEAVMPLILMAMLVLCTAFMSYSGSSGTMIIKL